MASVKCEPWMRAIQNKDSKLNETEVFSVNVINMDPANIAWIRFKVPVQDWKQSVLLRMSFFLFNRMIEWTLHPCMSISIHFAFFIYSNFHLFWRITNNDNANRKSQIWAPQRRELRLPKAVCWFEWLEEEEPLSWMVESPAVCKRISALPGLWDIILLEGL